MEEKKYKLLEDDTIVVGGRTLHRIEALRDFDNVKKGDKGGYVQSEKNLSHEGYCWVGGNAKVYDNAMVCDNAIVYNSARVFGRAKVCDNATVYGSAEVYNNAQVCGEARVYGEAIVYDNAVVFDNAEVFDKALVYGNAEVADNARVYDDGEVCGCAVVLGNVEVCGDATIQGTMRVCGDATIKSDADYIVFKNWWSSGRYFTWTRSNHMWCVGCFYGTGEELVRKAYSDSELSGREYERIVKYVKEILRDGRE